jgi:chromosome segregation protein
VITPEGIWLGRSWVRINAKDDPQVGVIARGEEIQQLRAAVARVAAEVDGLVEAQADTRSRIAGLEAARDSAQTELNGHQRAHTEAKSGLEAKRARLDQLRSRAGALDRSMAGLEDERQALTTALDECRSRLRASEARRETLLRDRDSLEAERDQYQTQVHDARMQADEDRERVQEMALRVESRRSSKQSASAALERVLAQQRHLQRRREELEAQIESSVEPLAGEESALREHLDRRLTVEDELNRARAEVESIDEKLRDAQLQRNDRQTEVAEARDAADNVRLAFREAQVRADTVAEQFQQTGFDLQVVAAELPADADTADWEASLEQIERRINRLGPINLAAIGEFDEQSERKQYLDTQYADLTEALETLENAIRKIDRETRSKFKDTFDKANDGLTRLFPRLFGGGHAYLELTGDDLLNSGVTVMARPPGKKISTIHLLSGGEKALTAVALVFSIFELNPAPFCLLDEVDAPLDDANVGRFSEIVKEMSDQVQFVLITHNKTTMEAMGQLTGVTMHEPGVSRLVAVDIDEAVQLAAM